MTETKVCTACQLAKMLETGVLSSSVEAGHSSCEAEHPGECACGCEYSRYQKCRECGRKGTTLDDHGQCVDRRDCSNTILADSAARRRAREERAAAAPASRSGGHSAAGKRPCTCGCGETTGGGLYRPGHDARHVSRLTAAVRDEGMPIDDAIAAVSHSEKLVAKLKRAIGVE